MFLSSLRWMQAYSLSDLRVHNRSCDISFFLFQNWGESSYFFFLSRSLAIATDFLICCFVLCLPSVLDLLSYFVDISLIQSYLIDNSTSACGYYRVHDLFLVCYLFLLCSGCGSAFTSQLLTFLISCALLIPLCALAKDYCKFFCFFVACG